MGLTNGTQNFGLVGGIWNGTSQYATGNSTSAYGGNVGGTGVTATNGSVWTGVTTDTTKSGIETEVNSNINYVIKY